MIISRTPLRISLGGGGTDLPSYYQSSDHGYLIAAAITKYVYIAVNRNFDDDYLLKYSQVERAAHLDDLSHPLLRECLRRTDCPGGVEISSMADIPAGTGLGSSGSFAVGVLKSLYMHCHQPISNRSAAEQACDIEINVLGEPVGKQDQFIAALGGIREFRFNSNGSVEESSLALDPFVRSSLEENLLLFYTGLRRSASEVLAAESQSINSDGSSAKNNLDQTREIGYSTRSALLDGDLRQFGTLLTEQWTLKYKRQPSPLHDQVNTWIEEGMRAGAAGGKLVGAGGGGFILFYAEKKVELRNRMSQLGLEEVRFGIDYEGSTLVTVR